VTLTGELAGKPWTQSYDLEFPARTDTANASIEGLWASRKVGFLLDEIRRNGETPELKDEVVALAEKHRLVTPYTSFLVREDEGTGTPVATRRAQEADASSMLFFAAEAPASETAGAVGFDSAPGTSSRGDLYRVRQEGVAKDAVEAQSGAGAVALARGISELKKAEAPMASGRTASRRIGERRFEFTGEKWMQVAEDLDKLSKVEIKYLSDAWFALHDKHEEIREIMKLGDVVEFEFKGTLIKIGAEGIEEVSGLPEALVK
jgi:Ca-activated chloride channel family protein